MVAEGQKGFEVAPVSIANLREIAALRQLLECQALEQSFRAGDMEWEGRVVAAHHRLARMEERMAQGDRDHTEEWKRYDWQFHQALISACGSRMLIDNHAAVFDKYLRYQMIALSYRGDIAAERACASPGMRSGKGRHACLRGSETPRRRRRRACPRHGNHQLNRHERSGPDRRHASAFERTSNQHTQSHRHRLPERGFDLRR